MSSCLYKSTTVFLRFKADKVNSIMANEKCIWMACIFFFLFRHISISDEMPLNQQSLNCRLYKATEDFLINRRWVLDVQAPLRARQQYKYVKAQRNTCVNFHQILTDISDAFIDFKIHRQDFLSVLVSICSPFKFIMSVFGLKHSRGHKCSRNKVFHYTLFPAMAEGGGGEAK